MTVEILRVYGDYVTKTIFTLTEWLVSPGGTKFRNRYKKCQKKNWSLFEVFLHVCEEERWHVLQVQSIRATIDHFLSSPPHNKSFFTISDQANKLLKHL